MDPLSPISTAAACASNKPTTVVNESATIYNDASTTCPILGRAKEMEENGGEQDTHNLQKFGANPRFLLGIETGRLFVGNSGDIYELDAPVGTGRASTVFMCKKFCEQEMPHISETAALETVVDFDRADEIFAVKVIDLKGMKLNHNFEKEIANLRKEAKYLQTLKHPCIVRFIDYAEASDAVFIVQEYLRGGELFYKIVEKGRLAEQQACFIAQQMLAALVFVHEHKIIHRDIKPENILIDGDLGDGFLRVKIADFGLAKGIGNCGSMGKTVVGTPQYWAPEVIGCGTGNIMGHYGLEADIWSFGVCLYVFLGGRYPFDGAESSIRKLASSGQFHFRDSQFARVSDHAKDLIRRALVVDHTRRITEKEIFYHPWMIRWLSELDRSRFHIGTDPSPAFCFMPPLPPLSPTGVPYPPPAWQSNPVRWRKESPVSSALVLGELHKPPVGGSGITASEAVKERDPSALKLLAESPDMPGLSVEAMIPGFVKINDPIPPFQLPVLLPLQLHLLLSAHLLTLSLRETSCSLASRKLQRELCSLQSCVRTTVGVFEVTATSAIESVKDIAAVLHEYGTSNSDSSPADSLGVLFEQIKQWICEIQKQGKRIGLLYENVETSVSELTQFVMTIIKTSAQSSEGNCNLLRKHAPFEQRDTLTGECNTNGIVDMAVSISKGLPAEQTKPEMERGATQEPQSDALGQVNYQPKFQSLVEHKGSERTASTGFDWKPDENCVDILNKKSNTRMDVLRDFLGSQIHRMLSSCFQSVEDRCSAAGEYGEDSESHLVDAAIHTWSEMGRIDAGSVTNEILDFLFLSSNAATTHAQQMGCHFPRIGLQHFTDISHISPAGLKCGPRESGFINCLSNVCSAPQAAAANGSGTTQGQRKLNEATAAYGGNNWGGENSSVKFSELSDSELRNLPRYTELQEKIAISRMHLKSLEKLRQLSYILVCICSFWVNFDVILCRLLQLQQLAQALIKYPRATRVSARAHSRLTHLKDSWVKFRTQCRVYLQLSVSRDAKLMDLGLQMQLDADQLDAIRALHSSTETHFR